MLQQSDDDLSSSSSSSLYLYLIHVLSSNFFQFNFLSAEFHPFSHIDAVGCMPMTIKRSSSSSSSSFFTLKSHQRGVELRWQRSSKRKKERESNQITSNAAAAAAAVSCKQKILSGKENDGWSNRMEAKEALIGQWMPAHNSTNVQQDSHALIVSLYNWPPDWYFCRLPRSILCLVPDRKKIKRMFTVAVLLDVYMCTPTHAWI